MKSKNRALTSLSVVLMVLMLAGLACGTSSGNPPVVSGGDDGLQQTIAALSVAETVMAMQQTQNALQNLAQPAVQETAEPVVVQPTVQEAAPAQDMDALIKGSRILLFEDTWQYGTWVYDTVKSMGLTATYDGDAIGNFLEHLNSSQWDLVIVVGEAHSVVQGEIWDAILTTLNRSNKPALAAEVWYLDDISEGRIKSFTTECGIKWQKDLLSAVPYFWLAPDSPFASNPGPVPSLTGGGGFWDGADAGDEVKLIPGSGATLLAGTHAGDNSNHGVITSCFQGRVIFQTFCDHDFSRGTVQSLWKNYITNTLTAHYQAIQ
jgi:hypothetical protein